ncbi:hypothetical protein GL2_02530 [Microbulbifer sp. GL-2]|nr:hypothetical protein GL2_02530 [Microbulbifer sp. GL-2]
MDSIEQLANRIIINMFCFLYHFTFLARTYIAFVLLVSKFKGALANTLFDGYVSGIKI